MDDVRYSRFNIPLLFFFFSFLLARSRKGNYEKRKRKLKRKETPLDTCQKLDSNPVGLGECRTTGGRGGEYAASTAIFSLE